MRKLVGIFGLACLFSGVVAPAAPVWSRGDAGYCSLEQRDKMLDKRVKRLTKKLDLTPEQQASVRKALAESFDARMAADASASEKIEASLTPEQQARYQKRFEKDHGRKRSGACCFPG